VLNAVSFVDLNHEAERDCDPRCLACDILTKVPVDVLSDAREQLREAGYDREMPTAAELVMAALSPDSLPDREATDG
jgi:hypothetical protein